MSVLDPSWQPGRAPDQARSTDPFAAAVARTRPSTTSLPIAATPTTAPPTAQPKLNPTRPGGSSALASNSTKPSTNPPMVTLPPGDGAVVITTIQHRVAKRHRAARSSATGSPTRSRRTPQRIRARPPRRRARRQLGRRRPRRPLLLKPLPSPGSPRIRKFFGEDPSEDDILPPSEALVEHVSPPITDDLPNSIAPSEPQPPTAMPEPQTAKTPWYGRLLR